MFISAKLNFLILLPVLQNIDARVGGVLKKSFSAIRMLIARMVTTNQKIAPQLHASPTSSGATAVNALWKGA